MNRARRGRTCRSKVAELVDALFPLTPNPLPRGEGVSGSAWLGTFYVAHFLPRWNPFKRVGSPHQRGTMRPLPEGEGSG